MSLLAPHSVQTAHPHPPDGGRSSSLQAFLFPATPLPPRSGTSPSPARGTHPSRSVRSSFLFRPTPSAISPFSSLPQAASTPSPPPSPPTWQNAPPLPPNSARLPSPLPPAAYFLLPCLQSTPPALQTQPRHSFKPSVQPHFLRDQKLTAHPKSPEASLPSPGSVRPAAVRSHRHSPPRTTTTNHHPATWRGRQALPTSAALR